jgi:hypothetical protein
MKLAKIAAAVLLSAAALGATASTASAAIVCNAENVCWHVRHPYAYRPEFGVVVHEDGWRWGPADHYAWREHPGRGYWYHGGWRRF